MREGRPSRTAYKVALSLVVLGAKPGMDRVLPRGLVESTARLLVASGAGRALTVRWARTRCMLSLYEAFDWMLPGQLVAFAHRKAFCEREARHGIDAGAVQVLVLGAGYDTLGWRLAPVFPGVKFFEIDHPATARLKAQGVAALGGRKNLTLIAEDLGRRRLADVLDAAGSWDGRARSVFIAEGLLMYLPPRAVRELLCECAGAAGKGSRIAFTYLPTRADGGPDVGPWTGLLLWLQKAIGEPWLWSIRPGELGAFLEETGWTIDPEGPHRKKGVEFFGVAEK